MRLESWCRTRVLGMRAPSKSRHLGPEALRPTAAYTLHNIELQDELAGRFEDELVAIRTSQILEWSFGR
jgi:hypothetical protein